MHAVVMESLEEYLAGLLEPAARRDMDVHISSCPTCREEVRSMQEISQLFRSFESEVVLEPDAVFCARVMEQTCARRAESFLAGIFWFDPAFARRLAFTALLLLAVMGSYLISRDQAYSVGPSPEAIMAQENSPVLDSAPAPDNMLITLTAYEH